MSEPERYECESGNGDYCDVAMSSRGLPVISSCDSGDGETTSIRLKPEDVPRLIAQLTAAQSEPATIDEYIKATLVIGTSLAAANLLVDSDALPLDRIVESVRRLITQVATAQGEPLGNSEQLPAESRNATEAIGNIVASAGFGGPNGIVASVAGMKDHITAQDETIASMCMRERKLQAKIDELSSNTCQLPDEDTMEVRIAVVSQRELETGELSYTAVGRGGQESQQVLDAALDIAIQNTKRRFAFEQVIVTAHVPTPEIVTHEVAGKFEESDDDTD